MGRVNYAAYCVAVGGTTWDGRPVPTWDNLTDRIRDAWESGAHAVAGLVSVSPSVPLAINITPGRADVITTLDDGKRCFQAFQDALQPILGSPPIHWEGFTSVVKEAWMLAAHAARSPAPEPEVPAEYLPGFED
jgi:hypothetical protein